MNQIQIAALLYECRDLCKRLLGNDWKKQVVFYTKSIKATMEKYKINNEIEAAMKLIEEYKDMDGSDVFTMKCLAATVEMIEPS